MTNTPPEDYAERLRPLDTGWSKAMGLHLVKATADEVVAEFEVGPQHRQPYGIVHGGVHSGVLESLASLGAAIVAMPRGQSVVGLENHTSFIRAAREGKLTATVTPITRGRTTQVWEGTVRDAEGRVLATGRVRLICIDAKADLAGGSAEVQGGKVG